MSELDSKAAGLVDQLHHETASDSRRRILVVGSGGRALAAMLALQLLEFEVVVADPDGRIDLGSHPRGETTNVMIDFEVERKTPAAWMRANLQALKLQAGEPFHPLSPEASGKRRAQWKSEIPYRKKP